MVSWTRVAATAAAMALGTALVAQSNTFQFVIAVSDGAGNPVIDITSRDVVMSEDGLPADVVKVEPFHMPIALTIGVDNGPLSADSLGHYRTGLTDLVKSLPPDVVITLIRADSARRPLQNQELKLHDLVSKERCRSMACRSAVDRRKRVPSIDTSVAERVYQRCGVSTNFRRTKNSAPEPGPVAAAGTGGRE
jgi:hypothetical protein